MPEIPFWYVGDRDPSISQTVTIDGDPVDLTGLSAKFKMRAVGDDTLVVDAAVSNTLDATGELRYDWQAADVDTAGDYLVWWEVTSAGRVQAVGEALIQIREHNVAAGRYLELEPFRQLLGLTTTTLHDQRATNAINAACQSIDAYCRTRFYPTAATTRLYTAERGATTLAIGDWASVTDVDIDANRDGYHETQWTEDTHYLLGPVNAAGDGQPYTHLIIPEWASGLFPYWTNAVKVTGTYGWAACPDVVRQAAEILATRLYKRPDTAYGILTVGTEMVAAARLGRIDPDVATLLENLPGRERPGQLRSVKLG